MAPPGRHFLLLLLVLTSFLLSHAVNAPWETDSQFEVEAIPPEKINKVKEGFKKAGTIFLSALDTTVLILVPFMNLIPVHGPIIGACVNSARLPLAIFNEMTKEKILLDTVISNFENLNQKLDNYRVAQKWDTWAASTYSVPERDIETAWKTFKTTLHAMRLSKDDSERNRHRDDFINITYPKYEPATKNLHTMLMVNGTTFMTNLGDLLAQHLWCHERDLREYSLFINKLIYKGNMMNQFYYKVKGIESKARVLEEATIAYDVASVMFQIHKQCIFRSMDYVEKDVRLLISRSKQQSELALQVRTKLEKLYDSYDWMVVSFVTKKTTHKFIESRNRHVLKGFTPVSEGMITVAVARQVKGTHTLAAKVREVIKSCIPKTTVCYKVADKLSKCQNRVSLKGQLQVLVSETYTAVHAYTRQSEDSHNAKEAPEEANASPEEFSSVTPHIYTGPCKKSRLGMKGKFVVLIKSDEEIMYKNPCSKLKCGEPNRGSCIHLPDTYLAMCECKDQYYGLHCEKSLERYKTELELESRGIIIVREKRTRRPRNGF